MNNNYGSNISVTGGAGYIGSVLVPELLAEGFSVTVIDALIYGQNVLLDCCANPRFEFIRGNICDEVLVKRLLRQHDIIIPLAAIVGAPACKRNPIMAQQVNLDAHLNMVKHTSAKQLVMFPTTNSGYGVGESDGFCTEETPLRPISEYAQTKVRVEQAFLDKGNAITLRLATVFGLSPRMRLDLLVIDFVYRAFKDRAIVLFEEQFRRNYIHVRDVAQTFLFGITNTEVMQGEPFNVGLSTANLTKRQLCQKIKEHVPDFTIHSSQIGKDPDQRDYLVSNDKLESLGWSPTYTLDMGIRELLHGYRILEPNRYVNC